MRVKEPLVSVIMPVYNTQLYLKASIESILSQTLEDFEFLIFNDGSTDESDELIRTFRDSRIRYFSSEENRGYVYHLNKGLITAKGKYTARMDSDDVSVPERLEKQVEFLESNPEVGILGSRCEVIDENDKHITYSNHYLKDEELRVRLLTDSCFVHPSVVMRKAILSQYQFQYDHALMPAEDYDLWVRLAGVTKLANLDEVLLKYRVHNKQITQSANAKKEQSAGIIRKSVISKLFQSYLSTNDLELHDSLFTGKYEISKAYIQQAESWLIKLFEQNQKSKTLDHVLLYNLLSEVWFSLCTHSTSLGPWVISQYLRSGFISTHIRKALLLKFYFKSLLYFSR